MDLALQRDFSISTRRLVAYAVFSACWITINGTPIAPVGLLLAVSYVGRTYETTYLRSLVSGWQPLAICLLIAVLGRLSDALSFGVVMDARTGVFSLGARVGF